MRKFILYAGMAFILSFYAVAKIEAGSSEGFEISIDSTDVCAEGGSDCTYVFTARRGSKKQIAMARKVESADDTYNESDWKHYDFLFTLRVRCRQVIISTQMEVSC
ncbi:MAG: hypothetical protein ACYSR1_03340 [Planctomycetota bacterium]|jgi:hypothetical protein